MQRSGLACALVMIMVVALVGASRLLGAGMPGAPGESAAIDGVAAKASDGAGHGPGQTDYVASLFVFMLASFIGVGVIRRVSRLLHTPLMSLTNAISAIAVVGSIMIAGGEQYPTEIRVLGAVALFCSMTNIISGFLITNRMLKMFKSEPHR